MKIDGRQIASEILEDLKNKVIQLEEKNTIPTMAVILIGNDQSSENYIKQKQLKALSIGASVKIFRFEFNETEKNIAKMIKSLDKDPLIHGIIIQRPAPKQISIEDLERLISSQKEIDGFGSKSLYEVPVAKAVFIVLEKIYKELNKNISFVTWLQSKQITILGKGETAGMPIINMFKKQNIEIKIIDSKTQNKDHILQRSDIIISAVGKGSIIKKNDLKESSILISVGMGLNKENKIIGDFKEEEIKDKVLAFTPTLGGIGPINVACLMQNLVKAATK